MLEQRMMMCANDDDGCVDLFPTPTPTNPSPLIVAEPAGTPTFPLTSVPQLSSRASATKKLYLDFVGDYIANWGNNPATSAPYHPNTIPAYDSDGDSTTFTQTELDNIKLIWAEVADKFSPFDLDVTTVKPANTAHGAMFQMDIGGGNAWYGSGGGVAYVGGFTNTAYPNVGFAFAAEAPTDINFVGADCAHEPGHGFGLNHQGVQNSNGSITEYSDGNGTTVPIMGNANNDGGERGIWFNGLETGVNASGGSIVLASSQDDLSILSNSTNGFGYRGDDWTPSNYTTMTFDSTGNLNPGYNGVIENITDDDPFAFQATAPSAQFTITQPTQFGMLAPAAVIKTFQGQVYATSSNTNNSCTITVTNLTPGNIYELDIKSQGGYGDIGSYQIGGTMHSFAYQSGIQLVVPGYVGISNSLFITDHGGTISLTDAISGGSATLNFSASSFLQMNISMGATNNTVNLGDGMLDGMISTTIDTGGGTDSVTLDDSSSSNVSSYVFGTSGTLGGTFYMNSGSIISFDTSVESVTLKTSQAAGDAVNVYGTVDPISIVGGSSGTINLGNGNTRSINAAVSISNPPARWQLTADDSADTTPRTVSISGTTITGLAPAAISWADNGMGAVTLDGGSGGNAFYGNGMTNTVYTMTVNLGTGNDRFINQNGTAGLYFVRGQAGTDLVQVVDSALTTAMAYNFSSIGFTRNGLNMQTDTNIEQLQLVLGSGNSTVTIPALPPATAVGIYGNNGTLSTSNTYNIGTASHVLPSFVGGLDIEDLVGVGTITLDDASRTTYTTTNITGTTWASNTTAGQLTYTVRHLVYDTDNASSLTNILSTTSNTTYLIKGGSGVNFLDVGAGSLSNVTGSAGAGGITYTGGSGTNYFTLDDSLDSVGQTYNLSATGLTIPFLLSINFQTNVSSAQLYGGTGNDTYNIPTTPTGVPIGIFPKGGVNAVVVSPAQELSSLVNVNGSSGSTALTYTDTDDGNFQMSSTAVSERILSLDTVLVNYSNLSSIAVNINNGGSGRTFNVSSTAAGTPVTVNEGSGTITINVNQTSPTGPVIVFPTSGNDPVNVDAPGQGTGPASVVYSQPQQTGIMNIGSAGLVTVSSTTKFALYNTGLVITGNGTIDITNDDFGFLNANLSTITALAKSGLNLTGGGTWNGPGLTSSAAASDTTHLTAVAVVQNNQGGTPLYSSSRTFDNSSPPATAILAKYTYFGDANIDGKVDGSDYSRIDGGYASHGSLTGWYNGDFNYDGVVDGSDYALIDNAFNNQRLAISSALVASATAQVATTKATKFVPPNAAVPANPSPFWSGSTTAAGSTEDSVDRLKMRKSRQ